MATAADALKLVKDSGAAVVDLRFCDLPGLMQHFSIPAHELTEEGFADGFGFDGSSIRGFQEIQESDMLLMPDPDSAYVDPFREHATVNLNCFVKDPVTGEWYTRDPRGIARKAEAYLKESGLADISYWDPSRSSIYSTRSASTRTSTPATSSSTKSRVHGTPDAKRKAATRDTSPGTRRATSRCRRWTTTRTSAPR
jgi:hypothetical protein